LKAARFERARERAKVAEEEAKADGLPILQGSPKQIAWGHDIRKNAVADFATFPTDKYDGDQLAKWAECLLIDRASWWIDNRADFRRSNIEKIIGHRQHARLSRVA
jgi:hypothetical protein